MTQDTTEFLVVDRLDALVELTTRLAGAPRLALDTEANSLHAFRERVCVVQLSVPGLDAIIDPLALPHLDPLRALLDRDDVEVVFHGGDYDVAMLSRERDFRFHRVFDTMIAATLLSEPRVGLSALVEAATGLVLSKRFQTADWARRPFSPAHLEYLRGDTRHLLGLREALGVRLSEADLEEEAEIEFRRLARRRGAEPTSDPDAWRGAKDAERLDARGRAIAVRLWAWREERARTHDLPRFRILSDGTLVALAAGAPADAAALTTVDGTQSLVRAGDGDAVLEIIASGVAAAVRDEAPPAPVRLRRTPEERARADAVRGREERIRAWRNDEARRRGVPNVVVLPNVAMRALCESPAASIDDLAAFPDIGAKRTARYGAAILALLAAPAVPSDSNASPEALEP